MISDIITYWQNLLCPLVRLMFENSFIRQLQIISRTLRNDSPTHVTSQCHHIIIRDKKMTAFIGSLTVIIRGLPSQKASYYDANIDRFFYQPYRIKSEYRLSKMRRRRRRSRIHLIFSSHSRLFFLYCRTALSSCRYASPQAISTPMLMRLTTYGESL